jgi:competence protein ComEA
MLLGEDLLHVLLLVAALVFLGRAARPPAVLGRAGPAPPCAVPLARPGLGVVCLARDEAARRGGRAGEGLDPDGLAAWGVPVDVNRATVEELASLEGIGPALAARIAAARPFASVEDVARVPGIGRRRLARLRPRLTLDRGR